MNAEELTHELGGRWHRRYGTAPCPVCQPLRRKGQNALKLINGRTGRTLVHCHKSGCDFADIFAAVGVRPVNYSPPDPATIAQRQKEDRLQAEKRARQAERCWQEALPIRGTPAEAYLRGRGITCDLPDTLRFHPDCWHASAKRVPALVALVEGTDACAVHRTYLRKDGTDKADIDPAKAMLGAVSGGAVRLTEAQGPLVVAEGIETALSLASGLLGRPITIWAALSTSGMRGLILPKTPGEIMVAVDGEDAGRKAGQALAQRATAVGWRVQIADPGDGLDFNDLLNLEGAA